MGFLPYINVGVQCLAGAIGIEGVNPTCAAYGYPTTGFIQQFMSWAPVVLVASVVFGVPMVVYLIHKAFEIAGIDLP